MKKTILTSVLLLMIGVSSIFAGTGDGVSDRVLSSFNKEFTNATDVKWEIGKEYLKATFNTNGQVMFAYYSENGSQLGMSRNIISANLPLTLNNDLKDYLNQNWITDLFEIVTAGETTFYVTIENADSVMVLRSVGLSSWEFYKKKQKG